MTRSIKTTLAGCAAAAALLAIPAGAHAGTLKVLIAASGVPGVSVPANVDCPDTSQFDDTRVDSLLWIRSTNGDTWVYGPYVIVVCDKW